MVCAASVFNSVCATLLEGVGVQALGACVLHCATAQNVVVKIHAQQASRGCKYCNGVFF
jgi:hypothetical protein